MSYESPIKLITDLNYKIIEDQEQNIYKAICSYGIDISKDELFKLLFDDRKQYDKGYSDGYAKAKEELVRCKDCKWWHDYSPPSEATWCARGAELRPQESGWVHRNADDFCSKGKRKEVKE